MLDNCPNLLYTGIAVVVTGVTVVVGGGRAVVVVVVVVVVCENEEIIGDRNMEFTRLKKRSSKKF